MSTCDNNTRTDTLTIPIRHGGSTRIGFRDAISCAAGVCGYLWSTIQPQDNNTYSFYCIDRRDIKINMIIQYNSIQLTITLYESRIKNIVVKLPSKRVYVYPNMNTPTDMTTITLNTHHAVLSYNRKRNTRTTHNKYELSLDYDTIHNTLPVHVTMIDILTIIGGLLCNIIGDTKYQIITIHPGRAYSIHIQSFTLMLELNEKYRNSKWYTHIYNHTSNTIGVIENAPMYTDGVWKLDGKIYWDMFMCCLYASCIKIYTTTHSQKYLDK